MKLKINALALGFMILLTMAVIMLASVHVIDQVIESNGDMTIVMAIAALAFTAIGIGLTGLVSWGVHLLSDPPAPPPAMYPADELNILFQEHHHHHNE